MNRNKSWYDHVLKEHNVYAYLYFIIYVRRKPDSECTGIEKYVKDKIKAEDLTFFPINKCLSLHSTRPVNENVEKEK